MGRANDKRTTNSNNEGGIPNPRCGAVLGASADHGARPRPTPQNPSQKLMAQWRSHTPHATCPRALAAPNSTKHPSEQRTSDFSEQRRLYTLRSRVFLCRVALGGSPHEHSRDAKPGDEEMREEDASEHDWLEANRLQPPRSPSPQIGGANQW